MADDEPQAPSVMRSVERALDLLRVIEESPTPLRLSDIAKAAGLHVATTQRILNALIQHDYVKQETTGYAMGITSMLNAHAFLVTNPLIFAATPVLQELAASTGLTTSLSMRAGYYQVILVRIEGSSPLRYQLPIGEKLPLQLGGARVLAATMSAAQIADFTDAIGEVTLASGDTVGGAEFIRSLEEISEQGYAFGISQRVHGAASVAVPVYSRDGVVLGGLQVSGLEEDFAPADVDRLVGELRRASAAVTYRHP